MPASSLSLSTTLSVFGSNYTGSTTVTSNDVINAQPVGGLAPGSGGSVTVQTNTTSGTVVMASTTHGVTTSDRVDLYWTGGSIYGANAATVSGATLQINGAHGSNFPAVGTTVTVVKPTSAAMSVTGNDVVAAAGYSTLQGTDLGGYVVYTNSTGTALLAMALSPSQPASNQIGSTGFAGGTVAFVYMSHGATTTRTVGSALYYN